MPDFVRDVESAQPCRSPSNGLHANFYRTVNGRYFPVTRGERNRMPIRGIVEAGISRPHHEAYVALRGVERFLTRPS